MMSAEYCRMGWVDWIRSGRKILGRNLGWRWGHGWGWGYKTVKHGGSYLSTFPKVVFELFQKLHLQIYASQFMTS